MASRFDGLELVDDVAFKDFDAAWEERYTSSVSVKVKGEEFLIPVTIPASLVLYQMRHADDRQNAEDIPGWLEAIVGKETLDAMVATGITWDQLAELTIWMLRFYGVIATEPVDEEGQEDGEQAVPLG